MDPNFFKREDFEKAVREELDVHNTPEKFDIALKAADIPPEFHKGGRRKTKNKPRFMRVFYV